MIEQMEVVYFTELPSVGVGVLDLYPPSKYVRWLEKNTSESIDVCIDLYEAINQYVCGKYWTWGAAQGHAVAELICHEGAEYWNCQFPICYGNKERYTFTFLAGNQHTPRKWFIGKATCIIERRSNVFGREEKVRCFEAALARILEPATV